MGSIAFEPEGPVFDPTPLFSRRVQRWEPGASEFELYRHAVQLYADRVQSVASSPLRPFPA